MVSTIENDLKMVDGVMKVVPKELRDWYGIEGIGFVWHGEWADPEIEYKGKRCSCYEVEDTLWNEFREEYPNRDEDEFEVYMWENQEHVKNVCDYVLFGKEI